MKKTLLLLCVTLAVSAHAERDYYTIAKPGTVRVGGFAGVPVGGDVVSGKPALGVDLIYQATRLFSIEGVAAFFRDDLPDQTFVDDGVEFSTAGKMNVQVLSLLGRLQVPLTSRWAVYGAGGVGYHRFDSSGERTVVDPTMVPSGYTLGNVPLDVSTPSEWGLHLGAGIACALSEHFELFLEYRHTMVNRTISYSGAVEAEKEIEVSVPGSEPGASAVETRTVTERAAGTGELDGNYDHGLARVGINCYF